MRLGAWNLPQRPRRRIARPVIDHDDCGSMLLALFATIILTSLVSVVLMATISQQAKTRKATDFTFAGQAADAAANDALMMANTNGTSHTPANVDYYPDASHPRVGVTGEFMWSWYSTQGTDANPTWEITAIGCRMGTTATCLAGTTSRTVHVTLTAAVVKYNPARNPEVAYILDPDRGFGRALFADQDLVLQGTTVVSSYSSAPGTKPGFGQVGTNGLAGFDSGVLVDGIYMSNTQNNPSADRCTGQPCAPDLRKVHDIAARLDISNTKFITEDAIPDNPTSCPLPLAAWVASKASSNRLNAGNQCYSSMTFDTNTSVSGSAVVYVTGPITVAPGVTVNREGMSATPVTSTLKIFSTGTVVSLSGGTAGTPTEVAWNLWAPTARCATNAALGYVTAYGSMVCQRIFTQGHFFAKWDYALATTPADLAGSMVWQTTGYKE